MTRDVIMESNEAKIALTKQFIERKLWENDELATELETTITHRKEA